MSFLARFKIKAPCVLPANRWFYWIFTNPLMTLRPRRSKLYIACSDLFFTSERAHAAAPPFQITSASLGCDLIFLNHKFQILSWHSAENSWNFSVSGIFCYINNFVKIVHRMLAPHHLSAKLCSAIQLTDSVELTTGSIAVEPTVWA